MLAILSALALRVSAGGSAAPISYVAFLGLGGAVVASEEEFFAAVLAFAGALSTTSWVDCREGPTARRRTADRPDRSQSSCVRSPPLAQPLPPRRVGRRVPYSRTGLRVTLV